MKAAKSEGLGLWTRRGGGLEAFSSTPPQSSRGCQGRASGEEGDKEASAERSAITKEEQESYQEEREVQSALGEGDSRHGIGRSGLRPDEDGSGPGSYAQIGERIQGKLEEAGVRLQTRGGGKAWAQVRAIPRAPEVEAPVEAGGSSEPSLFFRSDGWGAVG